MPHLKTPAPRPADIEHSANDLEERLLAALRASGTGTWKWSIPDDRVEWDEPLSRIYGLCREGSPRTAAEFIALVHPEDRAYVSRVIEAAMNGDDADYEFRAVLPDGAIRWIYDRSKLVRDAGGRPLYMIGACLDITKRKRFEQALIDSEARLELAASAADLGIWDWDLRTDDMVYSERAKSIFGFPRHAKVTLQMVRSATHPQDLPRTSAMAKRAFDPALREREPYEYRIIRSDGAVRWVLAHGHAIFEGSPGAEKAVRYVGTIQDISDRRSAEKALRDSESRLRLAIDAGRMAVWEYDFASKSMVGSAELNRLLGFPVDSSPTVEEVRAGYVAGEQARVHAASLDSLARGERFFEVEFQYARRNDGEVRWFLLRAEFELTPEGEPQRIIGVILDTTDRKRAAERQQLLVNELNHRVKNTLMTVQSIAAQTLRHAPDLVQARSDLEGRLIALSRTHDLLTAEAWQGASIAAVVDRSLQPFLSDAARLLCNGPDVWLNPRVALNLAMALQELATNAAKYGALSVDAGRIALQWKLESLAAARRLEVCWRESGGPLVEKPSKTGFGTLLIGAITLETGGRSVIDFNPQGLACTLEFELRDASADNLPPA